MDSFSLVVLLAVLALIAGIFVWFFSRIQEQHRGHYKAMIAAAGAHGLTFVDDPDPAIRLRLEGTVDGIKVRILSSISGREDRRGPRTEVRASCATSLPNGTRIELDPEAGQLVTLSKDGAVTDQYITDKPFRRAMEAVTKSQWVHPQAQGFADADGIHIQAPCLVDGEDLLNRMLSTSLNAVQALSVLNIERT